MSHCRFLSAYDNRTLCAMYAVDKWKGGSRYDSGYNGKTVGIFYASLCSGIISQRGYHLNLAASLSMQLSVTLFHALSFPLRGWRPNDSMIE